MDRRRALCTLAGSGVIVAALAACSTDEDGYSSGNSTIDTSKDSGKVLAEVSAISIGGGVHASLSGRPLVVVQPEEGVFRAFSAVCTHQGTTVGLPEDGVITCPNHFSEFSDEDGAVLKGPATQPLPEIDVEVVDGNVVIA